MMLVGYHRGGGFEVLVVLSQTSLFYLSQAYRFLSAGFGRKAGMLIIEQKNINKRNVVTLDEIFSGVRFGGGVVVPWR